MVIEFWYDLLSGRLFYMLVWPMTYFPALWTEVGQMGAKKKVVLLELVL